MHFLFNSRKYYFIFLISICLLISFSTWNIFSILFLMIAIFCSLNKNILMSKKHILPLFIILVSFVLFWFLQYTFDFNLINFIINKTRIMEIRNYSIEYIKNKYQNDNVESLLLLMLFNEKTEQGWMIYNNLKSISVCHIIVISGLHLNLLVVIINKIFRNKYLTTIINFIVLIVISIFLNFSIGAIRVFLMWIITVIDRRKILNQFEKLTLSAIIVLFLDPTKLFSFGFQMSYLATFSIFYINKIYRKKFAKDLLVNLTVNIYLYPMISKMSNTFSLWSFLYSYLFSWIYLFNFICFLFFYIPGIEYFYLANYYITEFSIQVFIQINVSINVFEMNKYTTIIYYLISYYSSWIIYKFKKI